MHMRGPDPKEEKRLTNISFSWNCRKKLFFCESAGREGMNGFLARVPIPLLGVWLLAANFLMTMSARQYRRSLPLPLHGMAGRIIGFITAKGKGGEGALGLLAFISSEKERSAGHSFGLFVVVAVILP